jgi:hypothetical protein
MLPYLLWAITLLAIAIASEDLPRPWQGPLLEAKDSDDADPNRNLALPPPRQLPFPRTKLKPPGDGYLRMPVRRNLLNGTHRRTGRLLKPARGFKAGMNSTRGTSATYPNTTGLVPRGWGWSHLDDYEGLAYMIESWLILPGWNWNARSTC